ncbi:helix-turn-helix domain-containing protein [Nonomuraea sp. NPDC050394]|uniref:helix-turn-helix domain-containing protein n=1 Tax=Nonomuraea sp. NPDC050394 TaxID=3364363 RepID=UPI0037A0988B
MITVRDLLNDDAFLGHQLLGGGAGLDQVVRNAALVHTGHDLSRVPPSSVAIMDVADQKGVSSQHLVEAFTRRLHGRGGRLLVIVGRLEAVSRSTVRLADRFSLPVVAVRPESVPGSAHALTARVLGLVQNPDTLYARAVASVAPKLAKAGTIDRILGVITEALKGTAALVTADGRIMAGMVRWTPPEEATRHPSVVSERYADHVMASCPVPWTDHQLWLLSEVPNGGPAWQEAARAVLQVAAPAVAAWVARDRLQAERERGRLTGLLSELLQVEQTNQIPGHVAARAGRAGIVLDGWHVGVHLTWLTPVDDTAAYMELTPQLTSALAEHGFGVPLFERVDGWSSWVTIPERPSYPETTAIAARLRTAVEWFNTTYVDHQAYVPLVGGVGRPATGPAAIAGTLAQAQQAAMVAGSDGPGSVESISELGPERLLLAWFRDESFQAHARSLLEPVLAAPDSLALLETLEAYLACGSSPTETARRLDLHRNTVALRIAAVERHLGASLADVDRLTLHLACRTVTAALRASRPTGAG